MTPIELKLLPVKKIMQDGKPISWHSLERICNMLNCQPGDVLIHEAASSGTDFDNEIKQRLEKLLPDNE